MGQADLTDDDAALIREVLEAIGARAGVETMIATRYDQALTALEDTPYPAAALAALRHVAALAAQRIA